MAFELFADYDRSGPSTPQISAKLLRHGLHNGSDRTKTDGWYTLLLRRGFCIYEV
jgi:hypothetical protein